MRKNKPTINQQYHAKCLRYSIKIKVTADFLYNIPKSVDENYKYSNQTLSL